MQTEHIEHREEELMTDLQFLEYKKVRDELEAAKRVIETLRANQGDSYSNGMTDYQFRRYEECRDRCEALTRELELYKAKCETLMQELNDLKK